MKEFEIYISTISLVVLITLSVILFYGNFITGAYVVKPSFSPSAGDTNWPMFHHDINNSGFTDIDGPKTNNSICTFYTLGEVRSSPAITNNVIYVGSYDNNVYALYPNCTMIWNYTTGGYIHSSPAIANGIVYIGSGDGKIYALYAQNGSLVWLFDAGFPIESSPTIWNNTVYIGASTLGGQILAIDALIGGLIWNNSACWSASAPVIGYGLVYFGCGDGSVRAFDAMNGSLVWNFSTGATIAGSPALELTTLYIGSDDGYLYALDALTGGQIWNFSTGGFVIRSTPAIAGYRLIFGAYDNRTYILDKNIGIEICNFTTGNHIHSSPAIAKEIAYFGSFDGRVYAINITNCNLIWSYNASFPIWSSPAVSSGSEFVAIGAGDTLLTFMDCIDEDGDGYNITGGLCGPIDCNDNNPSIYPGAPEIECNGVDEDCDGQDYCPAPPPEQKPRPTGGFKPPKQIPKPKEVKAPPKPPKEYNLTWWPEERRLELIYKKHQSIPKIDIYFKEGIIPPEDFEFKAQTKSNRQCRSELRNTVLSCTQIKTNLSSEDIERVELWFKVPNILLTEGRIDLDSLLAIKDKEQLKVEEVGADSSYTYFKVTASSFSVFALLGNAIPPLVIDIRPLQISIVILGICAALWLILLILNLPYPQPKPLHEYIKRAKKAGLSREEIKSRLLTVGWAEEQLEEILKKFF